MVHVATVLSTLVILWKEIDWIFKGLFKWQMNEETKYVINILISMIPIGIVGVFFKDYVEEVFDSGLLIVGCMLLVTAALLTYLIMPNHGRKKRSASVMPSLSDWPRPALLCRDFPVPEVPSLQD